MTVRFEALPTREVDRRVVMCALIRQRELLADPQCWTPGALARTLLKQAVVPLADNALSWSLTGALAPSMLGILGPRASQVDWRRLQEASLVALWEALPAEHPRTNLVTSDLDGLNDYVGTDHEDVLDIIDRAIDSLEHSTSR
jgi:hypothetical protein